MKKKIQISVLTTILMAVSGTSYFYFTNNDAVIKLDAPATFVTGELVVLDASKSKVTNLIWKIIPNTANFEIIDDGRRAIFSSDGSQKEYIIIIAGSKNGQVICSLFKMTEGNDIVINNELTALEMLMTNWLPEDYSTDEVIKLVQSFKSVARVIESSNLTNIDEIIQATAWSNKDALGEAVDKWRPFLTNLQQYLENNPPTNHAQMWRTIAQSLERVVK